MDWTHLGILFIHLIACCFAIGLILLNDIETVNKILKDPHSSCDMNDLYKVKTVVSLALIVLWISGIALISIEMITKGGVALENPKLQAKILIVAFLTINGVFLHKTILPLIEKFGSVLKLPQNNRRLAILVGSISGVSWIYAAFLGMARMLAWKYPLIQLLALYPVMIIGGFITMLVLVTVSVRKS